MIIEPMFLSLHPIKNQSPTYCRNIFVTSSGDSSRLASGQYTIFNPSIISPTFAPSPPFILSSITFKDKKIAHRRSHVMTPIFWYHHRKSLKSVYKKYFTDFLSNPKAFCSCSLDQP